jgi:hypothetical protein
MAKINNGGPAFPFEFSERWGGDAQDGMSLRDWFAGQALAGVIPINPVLSFDELAKWCYQMADAMIAEANKE